MMFGFLAGATLAAVPATADNADALLVDDVRLLDPAGDQPEVTEHGALLVQDGRIVYAGPAEGFEAPDGADRIDGSGLTVLPGLHDMHVHVWDEASLGAYLASGITTVRNLSGMPFHLELAKRIDNGDLTGPRLLTSGPILNSAGPNQQINHQLVETALDARAAVKAQAEAGYDRLKVYSNLKREPYEAVLDEAAMLGLRITGHPVEGERLAPQGDMQPFNIRFEEILDDGFETIEHTESIVWHAFGTEMQREAGWSLAQRIAASGSAVTPTLVAHHNLVRVSQSEGDFARREGVEKLNPVTQQLEAENIAFWAGRDPAAGERADAVYADFTRMMHEAGVLLVTGSDAGIFANIPGESLFDEMDLLVGAGIDPYEVIRMATVNPAKVLGESGSSGCLQAGCSADVVLYACDPIPDVSCLRTPSAVIRSGKWLDRAALDALEASASEHDPERTIRNLAEGMAAQGTPIDPAIFGN